MGYNIAWFAIPVKWMFWTNIRKNIPLKLWEMTVNLNMLDSKFLEVFLAIKTNINKIYIMI